MKTRIHMPANVWAELGLQRWKLLALGFRPDTAKTSDRVRKQRPR
jgi:hypothetical protein